MEKTSVSLRVRKIRWMTTGMANVAAPVLKAEMLLLMTGLEAMM